MWSLAFGLEGDARKASSILELYESARVDKGAKVALLLGRWLNSRMANVGDDAVTAPWATVLTQELVDCIEAGDAPIDELRLPCCGCGYAFASRRRAGRFSRTCGRCFPYEARVPDHPRGGVVQVKRGEYPKRRRGQTLGVTEHGTSVVCAWSDCLELVLVGGTVRDYCEAHAGRREEAKRLRARRPPKHERFEFGLTAGVSELTYCWGPLAQQTIVRLGDRRYARDEGELLTLVQLAASGTLVVVDTFA